MTKKALALILTVLLALAFACPVFAETTIEHPKVIVYGNVTKTVYPGRSIFEYKDDQGLSSVLPFSRQNQNITITFANMDFDKNLENTTTTDTSGSSALSITAEYLTVNDIAYIYLKGTNKTTLSANTWYDARIVCELDKPVTNEYYLIVSFKTDIEQGDNIQSAKSAVIFEFKDAGANTRTICLEYTTESGGWTTMTAVSGYGYSSNLYVLSYRAGSSAEDTYYTMQFRIQDILDVLGVSWTLANLEKITYAVTFKTGSTLDPTSTVSAYFRHALATPNKIYIDDPSYENGLIVNGTVGYWTPEGDTTLNVYGINCTKIIDVTIPFQWEITPEIEADADNLRMQYEWTFTMPQSPSSAEADSLTFSNTNITLYGYKDGDAWDKLYLNGVDKLSNIASKKVDETTGYWTYGLASSLTEGNMYQIIARITYTVDEYDSLTEAPVFWTNPVAWIQYKFWELVIAIASFLGLGTAWAVRQKRKLRMPKR